jgi:hypothetical protein
LTKGDTIVIEYNKKQYAIDILDVKSKGNDDNGITAVSIIETDLEVDFERPLDMPESPIEEKKIEYKEKEKVEEKKEEEEKEFTPFSGVGKRIGILNYKKRWKIHKSEF